MSDHELDSTIKELHNILKKYHLHITEYNKNLFEHILNKEINYIEIGATNDTKASGLVELTKLLGIPIEEVLVFGDGDNDLDMLSIFPNSVCMNNGSDKAKRYQNILLNMIIIILELRKVLNILLMEVVKNANSS